MKSNFPDYVEIGTLATPWKIDMHRGEASDGTAFYSREAKFMLLLAEALNFRFGVMSPPDGLGRNLGNGTWSGLVGMVQQRKCDLGIILLGMSEGRTQAVDFSYPYYLADVNFLTYRPRAIPKSFAVFYPFSEEVWATIVVSLLVVSVLFRLQDGRKSLARLACATFGSILRQSSPCFSRLDAFQRRFLFLSWEVAATFLALGYGATLLSYLLSPPLWGVRTISELSAAVARGTHACFTYKGSYIIDEFLESSDRGIRAIGESLAENSYSYQTPDVVILQSKRKGVFIAARPFLSPYRKKFFLSQESFFTKVIGIAIRPGFCCRRALDRATMRISEAGLYEKIFRDRDEMVFIKDGFRDSGEDGHSLRIDDTIGCFAVLVMGHLLATVVFVLELVTHKLRKMRKKNRRVPVELVRRTKMNATMQFYQALYNRGNKKINRAY